MTERENAFLTMRFQKPEWIPIGTNCNYMCGLRIMRENGPVDEKGQRLGGFDLWGVRWVIESSGNAPREPFPAKEPIVLTDVCEWKNTLAFPDVAAQDWQNGAKEDLADYKGDKILYYFDTEGLYNRLCDLMSTENALCALITDPEACESLFSAIADYKIKVIEHAARYIKPDVFSYMDDLASAKGMMISPDMYRRMIKPHHARIIAAIRENGMIAEQHCCGKCEDVIDDFVEIGVQVWHPAQAINDVAGIQKRHAGKLVIAGGADSQGVCFQNSGTYEDGVWEARRCIDTYAKAGGYMIHPPMFGKINRGFMEEIERYGREYCLR